MSTTNLSATGARSPVVRCLKWLVSWRGIRRVLIVLGWTATCIALFYAEENSRGRRAWSKVREGLQGRGIELDFRAFWPKTVADEQNFAATPVVKSWFKEPYWENTQKRWADAYAEVAKSFVAVPRQRRLQELKDLAGWERALSAVRAGKFDPSRKYASDEMEMGLRAKAASGVLESLRAHEAILAELKEASRRPQARYPLNFYDNEIPEGIPLPHLENLRAACDRLELLAAAELAAGKTDAAFEHVQLMFYLMDTVRAEPQLFSQWSRVFKLPLALQVVWEGLAFHAWSPSQLQDLTSALQRFDYLQDARMAMDATRAAGIRTLEANRAYLAVLLNITGMIHGMDVNSITLAELTRWPHWICRVMPGGWLDWEKVHFCQTFDAYLATGFEPSQKRVFPAIIEANAAKAESSDARNYELPKWKVIVNHHLATQALFPGGLHGIIRRFVHAQTLANQAALACALEQYRLRNGRFPETLQELAPEFISQVPKDIITGGNYAYRREENGFLIYSFGWNERDDGGVSLFQMDGRQELRKGDWVWSSTPAVTPTRGQR